MAIEKVLVIGNRDIARSIVGALSSAPRLTEKCPSYRISMLTWGSQTPYLPHDVPPGSITHKTSDFTSSSLEAAFKGEDVIIITVSGGSYKSQTTIIEAAIAAGVKRFVPHEFGYDTLNLAVQQRVYGGVERAAIIERLRNEGSKDGVFLEWVGVAVGCILDPMLLNGNLGFDLVWQSGTINGTGNEAFPVTSLERAGMVVESILRHWEEVKNQYVYAAGVITSGNEIATALEKNTKSKWCLDHSEVDDCVREGRSRIERGFLDSGMFLLERSVLYDEALHAAHPFQHRNVNDLLNLRPETIHDIVSRVVHDFDHHGKPSCGCGS
ncbi:hypothetical protein P280DRAFT_114288 [Massarina eburnea CBS 473.64]|uniref:NmrA-like domain-containing protein n=1 Tax=Massarina eburnea CBS 473.64 TaxID=1395130 RepID=A0A6A6RPY4_9PLEO|nr:hypothetical protein P280DRAFT_114288 [Massarina eburnea CBS 473.64]